MALLWGEPSLAVGLTGHQSFGWHGGARLVRGEAEARPRASHNRTEANGLLLARASVAGGALDAVVKCAVAPIKGGREAARANGEDFCAARCLGALGELLSCWGWLLGGAFGAYEGR